jgi:two-component sensor histidine kinase/HAMP domain-containing protein
MKISIKWALIGGFIGLQVIPVSIILVSSYLTSQKVLLRHAKGIMENIATFTIHEAQGYLNPAQDAASLTQRLADSDVISRQNKAALEQYFYEQLGLHADFAGIYLGSPTGEFLYVSRIDTKVTGGFRTKSISVNSGIKTTELIWKGPDQREIGREFDPTDAYDPRKRPWYIKAEEAEKTIWTEPYIFFTSRKPGLTVASPVFDTAGRLAGVVGVDIEIDELSTFLSRLKVGKHGLAFILDRNGNVVAFPDSSKIKRPTDNDDGRWRLTKISELDDVLSRKAFASLHRPIQSFDIDRPVFGFFRHAGKNYHTMFAPFSSPQWPWVIGIYIPEDDYLGPIKRNRLFNIYVIIGIAALASLAGFMIARSIVKPMVAFQAEAHAVRDEDLDTTIDKRSAIKEIQETADSFMRMKEGLKATRHRNVELTEGLKQHAEELRHKEMHLRATFTSLVNFSDALIVLDEHHMVRFINPAAESLLGVTADQTLDQPFTYAVVRDRTTEIDIDPGSKPSVVAEMRVVDTEWEGRAALLVSLRDITERKRMYEKAQQDAETKSTLLQEVNHRVKNNLSAIIGMLYAERRHTSAKENALYQAAIQDLISRMQGLATAHSLLTASEWKPLRLNELAKSIVYSVLHTLPHDKRVATKVAPSLLRVPPAQANSLAMVMNEMSTNTVKYALQHKDTGNISVDISMDEHKNMVLLEFRDDGPGYPEDVLQLKRYNTGMYLIQTIVSRDLHGTISLSNDFGAVTTIRFPAADGTREESHA